MYGYHVDDDYTPSQQFSNTIDGGYTIANRILDAPGFNPFQQSIALPASTVERFADLLAWEVFPCA
jgi:hypothetical protein